jgi:hypothetical protein
MIPDTQIYSFNFRNTPNDPNNTFTRQTNWIRDNVVARNIKFVTHVGDIVDGGGDSGQWQAATAAMNRLAGVVPHGALPGNHDYATTGNKSTGLASYTANMGPSRFDPYRYQGGEITATNFHGGFMPTDFGGLTSAINVGNSFQLFTSGQGGHKFLNLSLEWQPNWSGTGATYTNRRVYEWAQSVIDAFPGVPTIITTHEDLRDADINSGNGGVTSFGADIFNRIVRDNDQVFMMLSGHNHFGPNNIVNGDGEWRRVDKNAAGNDVVRIMATFQDWPRGGDGYLRLLNFDLDAPQENISVQTYSPTQNLFLTDFIGPTASQFSYDMDFFGGRFAAIPEPSSLGLVLALAPLMVRRRAR